MIEEKNSPPAPPACASRGLPAAAALFARGPLPPPLPAGRASPPLSPSARGSLPARLFGAVPSWGGAGGALRRPLRLRLASLPRPFRGRCCPRAVGRGFYARGVAPLLRALPARALLRRAPARGPTAQCRIGRGKEQRERRTDARLIDSGSEGQRDCPALRATMPCQSTAATIESKHGMDDDSLQQSRICCKIFL